MESNSHRDFSFRSRHVRVGSGSLARLRYSLSADNNVLLSDVVVVVQPDDGGMTVSLGRREEAVLPGSPVLLPAHQAVSVLWADTVADCVGVQSADVERVAVETTGLEGTALRFTALRPMSPALGRRWSDAVRRVVDVLVDRPEVGAAPLVATALTQRLAQSRPRDVPQYDPGQPPPVPPDHATPAVVRRAVEHIEANAHRAMTLTEIADAAGIGARGLHASVLPAQPGHGHRPPMPNGCGWRGAPGPRGHRPRGSRGRADDRGRWGFADHSRFAAAYRETYGRLSRGDAPSLNARRRVVPRVREGTPLDASPGTMPFTLPAATG